MIDGIYPWQQAIWRQLYAYIKTQRLPQAILLTGSPGIGKRRLAEVYAAALLCQTPDATTGMACGSCAACHLLQADTHSDYQLIEPEEVGKVIGIDRIRQLINKLALKPQFAGNRLVILQPADQLNTASANAFLKCLEEPTERTGFILITAQPGRLPATIRSRCQHIHCPPPDAELAGQWLRQQGVTEEVDLLLKLAQGAPLLAQDFAQRSLPRHRQNYFEAWRQIAQGKGNVVLAAEQWQKQESVDLTVLLDWLIAWVMDIVKLVLKVDGDDLGNPDFKTSLQALSERLELKALYRYYDSLLQSRALLNTQINKQLLIEKLLIDWAVLNRH